MSGWHPPPLRLQEELEAGLCSAPGLRVLGLVPGGCSFSEQCCTLDVRIWLRLVAKLVHLYWHGMTGLLHASWIEKLPSCTSAAKASP